MFPSSNSSDNPLESLFKRPSFQLSDQNPIPKQDDPPFFSNFPSPFFDEHELPLNQILSQNLLMPENHCLAADQIDQNNSDSTKKETAKKMKEKADDQPIPTGPSRRRNLGSTGPRKRTGKKDRHSKICTAQGIRDRRMRLSLQVARKFFDLQDMLGFDKASKTIEWLFNKSKKAIKELTKDNIHPQGNNYNISISDTKSESFLSECEVVSGIEETSNNEIKEGILANNIVISPSEKDHEKNKPRKNSSKPNMRESREKARARARCRTREKMMIKRLENSSKWCKSSPNHSDLQKLGSSSNSPFEVVDQESGLHINQERVSPYVPADNYPSSFGTDVGIIEKLLGNSTSTYQISDYNHCSAAVSCCIDPNSNFMGFLGNWELLNNDRQNSSYYAAATNQVSLAGNNPNSVYSATNSYFPLFHQ